MEEEKKPRLTTKGKVRKELTPEALDKLAQARQKANAIRKENAIKKLEAKVEAHRGKATDIADKEETEKDIGEVEEPFDKEDSSLKPQEKEGAGEELLCEEEPEVKVVKKKSTKKKTKIIVEQSSSDSDEFEPNDNVVFVKRVSRKKKEPIAPQAQVASIAPPEPPDPPPKPPTLSREQARFNQTYDAMFNGGFLRNRFY
jgi:hypothetical protein